MRGKSKKLLIGVVCLSVLTGLSRWQFIAGELDWFIWEMRDAVSLQDTVPSFGARSDKQAAQLFAEYWVNQPLMLQGLAWPSGEQFPTLPAVWTFEPPRIELGEWVESVLVVGRESLRIGSVDCRIVTVEARTGEGRQLDLRIPVGQARSGRWYVLLPGLKAVARRLEDDA